MGQNIFKDPDRVDTELEGHSALFFGPFHLPAGNAKLVLEP